MIKDFKFEDFNNPYQEFKRTELGEKLAKLQRRVKDLNIPVLIIVDGWESSGKGYVIKDLIRELDPRTSRVQLFEHPTDEEKARPFLWRFWKRTPKRGNIAIYDRSFYFKVMNDLKIKDEELERDIKDISSIEKQLFDDHMIIIKFFLHQKEKTMGERIEILLNDEHRSFFITERDLNQKNEYEKYLHHFDHILKMSSFSYSPWHIISSEDFKSASKYALGLAIDLIEEGIERCLGGGKNTVSHWRGDIPQGKIIGNIDLSLGVDEGTYEVELKKLQEEAQGIAYKFYTEQIPCIIVFEGMDAAGKGGAIQRLTRLMDPRGLEVIPISAPDETERNHHYLWRFYRNFPPRRRIAIFDRSWYGRVLVERIEGFASAEEWNRAYEEINQMEKHLHNFGTLMLKFLICIDKDEQLIRFQDRENEADKLYKITDEDWRNREKWDQYLTAFDEMLLKTNTNYAPWIIVEGNNKKYARLKVLKNFVEHGKRIINQKYN
ncbi:phosphate--AMP phosphotransferase [Dehalobacterium formicoaceticum]|uniref:Phosphate--AMP phosphotransferase n=1 Tax=Dehalobacterium formicoaceticum TaxID=51515 RepID=A0ABT1Y544_9FIRM|nr:phosphate--AMP phosphotransferase [Dehalobacterium formicoaceticum]MCR6546000.1 phosphate--AMP phosphotransferase [Dehalobacterium formicoaceticum]